MIKKGQNTGTILIIALWSLGMLSVFAIYLGIHVRQEIIFLSRLEKRQRLQALLESCMKKALVILANDARFNEETLTAEGKRVRHDNDSEFQNIAVGEDTCAVSYQAAGSPMDSNEKKYGMADEESKININRVDSATLKSFFQNAFGWSSEKAQDIAGAIYDWRVPGESRMEGFFSQEYYENLQHPYSTKKGDFEVFDELLLVKGVNEAIYRKLLPYITVYGDGKININTAPALIMSGIGMHPGVVTKILLVRRGKDGLGATADDYIFRVPDDLVTDLGAFVPLSAEEIENINQLVNNDALTTRSQFYRVHVEARLANAQDEGWALCVFDSREKKILYLRQQF